MPLSGYFSCWLRHEFLPNPTKDFYRPCLTRQRSDTSSHLCTSQRKYFRYKLEINWYDLLCRVLVSPVSLHCLCSLWVCYGLITLTSHWHNYNKDPWKSRKCIDLSKVSFVKYNRIRTRGFEALRHEIADNQ